MILEGRIVERLQNGGIYVEYSKFEFFVPKIFDKNDYKNVRPFNHYESPYPDIKKIHLKEDRIFDYHKKHLGIDFNLSGQLELLEKFEKNGKMDWSDDKRNDKYRYFYSNGYFGKGSSNVLYWMMNVLKPSKIIEVGSGYSTAAMLDTNEFKLDNLVKIISIEPRPKRLRSILKESDNIEIIEKNLEEVPIELFEELNENDILFIDSSHVSKIDSDVNYYFFEIFPRLKKNVYIHLHDVFYPFIYPKEWVYEGRAYNEMYMLQAFLMYNTTYSVQFFWTYLFREYPKKLKGDFKCLGGGSIWIKRSR